MLCLPTIPSFSELKHTYIFFLALDVRLSYFISSNLLSVNDAETAYTLVQHSSSLVIYSGAPNVTGEEKIH